MTVHSYRVRDISATRSPAAMPVAMSPLASAATSSANCRAVTSCQPAFPVALLRRMTTRPGSLAARSNTTSVRLADDGMSTEAGVLYSRIPPD